MTSVTKRLSLIVNIFMFLTVSSTLVCSKTGIMTADDSELNPIQYYSDYFVFIADDGGEHLVVPMDFNWRPGEEGYETEYKAWFGTQDTWPIAYRVADHDIVPDGIPDEIWDLPAISEFTFDAELREIRITFSDAPEIVMKIPELSQWTMAGMESDSGLRAARGTIRIDGIRREGWILYERIRRENTRNVISQGFGRFHWIPLVVDGDLYHFLDNGGDQAATRWIASGENLITEQLDAFSFVILEMSEDMESGRSAVPEVISISAEHWQVDIMLESGGHQTGYGTEGDSGLALYRQSLLESTIDSNQTGYGMLELILAD